MLRKLNRTIGSTDFVTVDFNPRKNEVIYGSSVGTEHLKYQMHRHYVTLLRGSSLFRGLKSTVTTSSEPTALLGLRNINLVVVFLSSSSITRCSKWYKTKYFQYFLLLFTCDIVSAQVMPNVNPVKTISSSDDIIENEKIQNYNLLKKDTTLGSIFQSMNEIRIGLALYRIRKPDSVVHKYLWNSLSINKEQSCSCLNTLERFKDLDSSYSKLRNKDWFKILRFCNYRVENLQVLNKFNESLEHDLEIILDNDQKYRGEIGILGFILGDSAIITKKVHKLQKALDLLNLNEIENIFSRIGSYPTRKMLANQDLFTVPALVIIHCGSISIQEKYLPFLLDAYKKESLLLEEIKILIDKIYVHKYNKQVFGTQFGYWDNQLKKKVKYPFLNKEEAKKIISQLNIEK